MKIRGLLHLLKHYNQHSALNTLYIFQYFVYIMYSFSVIIISFALHVNA